MQNLVVNRKTFVLILITNLLMFSMHNIGYNENNTMEPNSSASAPLSPEEIQKETLPCVVGLIRSGKFMGSGVLISKELKLVLTNAHVTKSSNDIEVFFPAYNSTGELIQEEEFYFEEKNRSILRRLGYVTRGRVIDENFQADVATVRLEGLPKTAKEIKYKKKDFDYSDMKKSKLVYIFGHPSNRELLWQWDSGVFQYYGESLEFYSDGFLGNSGGPVVNEQGVLIGLVKQIGLSKRTFAVPMEPIYSSLVNSYRKFKDGYIFWVRNKTQTSIEYEIKWSENGDWIRYPLESEKSYPHWKDMKDETIDQKNYPKIRYRATEQDPQTTKQKLKGKHRLVIADVKGNYKFMPDDYYYDFMTTSAPEKMSLHELRQTLWIANSTTFTLPYHIQWQGGKFYKSKPYTLEPGKLRAHWRPDHLSPIEISENYPKILYSSKDVSHDGTEVRNFELSLKLTTALELFGIEETEKQTRYINSFLTSKSTRQGTHYYHFRLTHEKGIQIDKGLPHFKITSNETETAEWVKSWLKEHNYQVKKDGNKHIITCNRKGNLGTIVLGDVDPTIKDKSMNDKDNVSPTIINGVGMAIFFHNSDGSEFFTNNGGIGLAPESVLKDRGDVAFTTDEDRNLEIATKDVGTAIFIVNENGNLQPVNKR